MLANLTTDKVINLSAVRLLILSAIRLYLFLLSDSQKSILDEIPLTWQSERKIDLVRPLINNVVFM